MCWQEMEDRPSVDDILAFLQQIEDELASQSHDLSAVKSHVPINQTGIQSPNSGLQSPKSFDSKFVMSKNVNQSNQHVAEVLVHRVDDKDKDKDHKHDFDDDFSKSVKIRRNKNSDGFEDDFVHGDVHINDSSYLPQNDSILAYGGNQSELDDMNEQDRYKDMFSPDQNLNLLHPPVPVKMSTPSKQVSGKSCQSDAFHSALSSGTSQISKYVTASGNKLHASTFNPDLVRSNSQSVSPFNPDFVRSDRKNKHPKELFSEKSDNQNSDEGYRTHLNESTPDIILKNSSDTDSTKQTEVSEGESIQPMTRLSPKLSDLETEEAKELYMSKGAGLPTSIVQKSRSLGTIPEDGIPSDNTSQSGVVFEDQELDGGMNYEWDDYDGEQLVGCVKYASDETNPRSPRHVDVEEWPFDQDSSSDSHSKPGSIASDSDGEVTRLSMGTNSSIDTRSRIASILTNRLNSFIKQTNNSSPSGQGTFYSISRYDNDLDSPEHAYTEIDYPLDKVSGDREAQAVLSMPDEEEEWEIPDASEESGQQGQVIINYASCNHVVSLSECRDVSL